MKTILIPTDFSENSLNAFQFAADFFNHAENKFLVCNVYDIPRGGTSGLFTLLQQLKEQSEKNMEEFMTSLSAKYADKSFTMESKVLQGNFEDAVAHLAEKAQADFVVMGTKGSSGLKDKLIGSNAASVLKSIKLPVFAIPTNYNKAAINQICFSYDGAAVDQNDLQLMLELSKQHELPIKVLHVRLKEGSPIQNWAELEKMLGQHRASLHEVAAENFEEGLKNGIEGEKDMLVLIRRKKSFWEWLINDSDTQKVIKHFQIPIMVLPDVD